MFRDNAWTTGRSRRRAHHTVTLTGVSVAVAFLVRIVGLFGTPVSTYANSGLIRELHPDDWDDYCVPGRDWTDRARAANSPRDRAPAFARRLET